MPSRFENRLAKLEKATRPPRPRRGDAELTAAIDAVYDGLDGAGALFHDALVLVHGAGGAARFEDQCRKIYGPTADAPTSNP